MTAPQPRPKVLVTGSNGLIGRGLVEALAPDHDLVLWDKTAPAFKGTEGRAVDLTDANAVRAAMPPVDAVVHLAIASFREIAQGLIPDAEPTPESLAAFEQATLRVNNDGAYHVMQAAKESGVSRFIYMSSLTIHNAGRESGTLDVRQDPRPRDLYACTKLFGENLGRLLSADGRMSVVCLRMGQPFPVEGLPALAEYPKRPKDRAVLVHYDDVNYAVRCALEVPDPPAFGLYNLVSAQADIRFPREQIIAEPIGFRPRRRITEDGEIVTEEPTHSK